MAIAGRSYPNVPVVVRGTLQDPPVLTTAPPVVVAQPYDRRWFAPAAVTVTANPQAPAVVAVATPGPVVVSSQPPVPPVVQATVIRSTLADPPVLATAPPYVIAAPYDRRIGAAAPPIVIAAPLPAPGTATPGPVVIAAPYPVPKTVQAIVLRGTLADPAVLTTAGPLLVAAPYDRRWFNPGVRLTFAGSPIAAPPPAPQQGTVTVTNVLAATATILNSLAGSVTIVNDL